jgi:hypothetical protein
LTNIKTYSNISITMASDCKEAPNQGEDIASVLESIRLVQKAGFGEVRIMVRNGAIYRILKTEDKFVKPE